MKLQDDEEPHARLEMTPIMDVVFLLIVFFVYAFMSMTVQRGVRVELPRAEGAVSRGDSIQLVLNDADEVFLDGRTALPRRAAVDSAALRAKEPPTTPEAVRAAVAEETARTETLSACFARLTKAKTPEERAKALAEIDAIRPLPRGWGALLMPHFLSEAYLAKDVPAGLARANALLDRFKDDAGALEMLRKVIDAWPELALEATKLRCDLALRLGELNDRDDPAYAQAWVNVAAEEATRLGKKNLVDFLRFRACVASPTACRLAQFLHRLPALPAR